MNYFNSNNRISIFYTSSFQLSFSARLLNLNNSSFKSAPKRKSCKRRNWSKSKPLVEIFIKVWPVWSTAPSEASLIWFKSTRKGKATLKSSGWGESCWVHILFIASSRGIGLKSSFISSWLLTASKSRLDQWLFKKWLLKASGLSSS